jgi:hypothetical protein
MLLVIFARWIIVRTAAIVVLSGLLSDRVVSFSLQVHATTANPKAGVLVANNHQ